jgi:putative ABC transport system ATP-binding protein
MSIILETRNLTKTYGRGETKVEAVKSASISIEKGKMVSIIGQSGSGKSTFLNMLGGLDTPTSGAVIIDGKDLFKLNQKERTIFRRRKIGFVFQNYNLISALNVEENIIFPILLDHKKPDMEYIKQIIEVLGLKDRIKHMPSQLSGGQQQRVAIGRALAGNPAIILADEPTGNLDTNNSRDILKLIKLSAKQFNQTVIIVTHNQEIASKTDQIITISDGIVETAGGIKDEKL